MTHTGKAIQVLIAIGLFVSIACATSTEKKLVNVPMVPVSTMASPLSDASSAAADAAIKRLECGGLMQRGSFCDVLTEVRRAMKTDGDGRRCLWRRVRKATSALPGIGMWCQAYRPLHNDCAGNPPGQSDAVAHCAFYIGDDEHLGYEYDDRSHDILNYLRDISAAITACDSGYRALPLRSVGDRDKAIQFSRFEPGSPLQEVVSICSELVTPLANEPETSDESRNPRYYIIMQIYGTTVPSDQAK